MSGVGFCSNSGTVVQRRSRGRRVCSVMAELASGDKVRVKDSVIMYHVAKQKDGMDAKGLEGEVVKVILDRNGVPLTLNRPVQVKFSDPKFIGHFEETELERL
eukprot:Plantae.Rhodophyta-Purpureofilum_apyrenoidigerum.ctg3323.p2 GENE.Plantae.Rhodophyta-Purpureofilum_apyrenoidigerum.ctg3323~~Plantae.Rhodophyta-Purpureofilum_apyrenoidigerum.ctg3323.p2  ORF type:complete len:103 (-),score=26.06 Plantae.Rhodophyta-Purpureofilum_apyrenoidigerum.ctg3323:359-667(-)